MKDKKFKIHINPESRKTQVTTDALAGAIAGIIATTAVHPLDTKVVQKQVANQRSLGLKLLKGALIPAISYPTYFLTKEILDKSIKGMNKTATLALAANILRLGKGAINFTRGFTGLGGGAGLKQMLTNPMGNKAMISGTAGSIFAGNAASKLKQPSILEQMNKPTNFF